MSTGIVNVLSQRVMEIYNFMVPCEGAEAIPLLLDFATFTTFTLDLKQFIDENKISMVQSIFVDLSTSDSAMVIEIDPLGLSQTIVANPRTQGYYVVLAPNPTRMTFTCASAQVQKVHLINAPVSGVVWAATHP